MALGISFGKNKQKINTTTTSSGTETTNQNQTGTKSSTGTTTNTQTGTSSQQTTGSQTGQTTQTGQQTQQNQQTGSQTQTNFGSGVLAGLESQVMQLLGQSRTAGSFESGFDPDEYVSGVMAAAEAKAQNEIDLGANNIFSTVGGRENSMSQLLSAKLRNDSAASLAGVRAGAEGQAQGILRENFMANAQAAGQDQGFLAQLTNALKGGVSTGTTTEAGVTTGSTSQTGTSAQQNQQNQIGQESQTSTQVQELTELLSQILSGTTTSNNVENTQGTTTKKGGGFGLSL